MSQGILVFIEARGGQLRKASLEALSEANRQIAVVGGAVTALVVGKEVRGLAGELSKYGAARVLVADDSKLADYSSEAFAQVLSQAVKAVSPKYVFGAYTAMAKDFFPRAAARLDAPCVSDVMSFKADGANLLPVRAMYSGKTFGTYEISADTALITLRPNVFAVAEAGANASVEDFAVELSEPRARVTEVHASQGNKIELSEASIVVCGGRGIKGPENWPILQSLCDELGAALAASRAVVDAGWIDHQHQVGQTGKTVSPKLYIACGISGAIQHLAGMSSSKVIVAINKDPEAPIFKHATYGIVGDCLEVVPKLTAAVKQMHEHN